MNFKKNIGILLLIVALVLSVCSCGKQGKTTPKYNEQDVSTSVPTQIVSQNEKYELLWNNEAKCVVLKNKDTGKQWSTIPVEVLKSNDGSTGLKSTINISVLKKLSTVPETVKGYIGTVENGRTIAEKTKDGIKILYCFDEQKIIVPVYYSLDGVSVKASVKTKEIVEAGEYSLISLDMSPYLMSAKNDVKDSYLFVPSGSGAIMYANEKVDGDKTFTGNVYGADTSELITNDMDYGAALNLPVMGVKEGDNSLLAIIESGAESATVTANSGDSSTGFSNIYASFAVRGLDTITPKTALDISNSKLKLVSEEMSDAVLTVGYYPLSGEGADYNGMAKAYRSYLSDKGELTKGELAQTPLSISVLGGVETTKTTMGVPNKQLSALTEVEEVEEILEKITSKTVSPSTLRLIGFGESGIMPGKVGGGFKISSKLGNKKDIKSLEKYCGDNGISMYTDYDIIRFKDGGSGFTTTNSVARTATLKKAVQSLEILPLNQNNKEYSYYFLSRSLLTKAVNKLIKATDKSGISGISLSTLGSMAYSDFKHSEYSCKTGMADDVKKSIAELKEAGHKIATANAYGYAAGASDVLYDVPIDNGGYDAFDISIPFYQMVFSGYKTMFSSASNVAASAEKQLVLSAACGVGLNYSLIYDFKITDMEIKTEKIYGMMYENNIDLITEQMAEYEKIFDKIGGAALVRYEALTTEVSKSVFENGVVIYANNSDKKVNFENIEINGYGFVLAKEGK